MKRYAYLWGTREKNYCELGRTEHTDEFLRSLDAANPEMALRETQKMLGGFAVLPGYAEQENRPVAIRYAPMHLYKRVPSLQNMKPFSAISINGLERDAADNRESYYTHLTLIEREELLQAKAYNYLDYMFGIRIFTAQDEADYKNGMAPLMLDIIPVKEPLYQNQKDLKMVFLTVAALYQGANWHIVIQTERGINFMARAWNLLKQIYSLLPPRMAVETGFSVYERPENIRIMSREANTRIFIIPAECGSDLEKYLPEQTIVIDMEAEIPVFRDEAFRDALVQWNRQEWDIRLPAMKVCFESKTDYFKREYYIAVTRNFFKELSDFEKWVQSPKLGYEIAENPEGQLELIRELYRLYEKYSICKIYYFQKIFTEQIEKQLPEKKRLKDLRIALIQILAGSLSENDRQECILYYQWLNELDSSDIALESSQFVYRDGYVQGERQKLKEIEKQSQEWEEKVIQLQKELGHAEANLQRAVCEEAERWQKKVTQLDDALGLAAVEKEKAVQQVEEKWSIQVQHFQKELEAAAEKQAAAVNDEIQKQQELMAQQMREFEQKYQRRENEFDSERQELLQELNDLNQEIISAENREKTAVKKEKEYWGNEVSRLQEQLTQERKSRKEAEEKANETAAQLQVVNKKYESLGFRLNKVQSMSDISKEELADEVERLKNQNVQLENQNVQLKKQNKRIQNLKTRFQYIAWGTGVAAVVSAVVTGTVLLIRRPSDTMSPPTSVEVSESETSFVKLTEPAATHSDSSIDSAEKMLKETRESMENSEIMLPEEIDWSAFQLQKNGGAVAVDFSEDKDLESYLPDTYSDLCEVEAVLRTRSAGTGNGYTVVARKKPNVQAVELTDLVSLMIQDDTWIGMAVDAADGEESDSGDNHLLAIQAWNAAAEQTAEETMMPQAVILLGENREKIDLSELFAQAGIENWWQKLSRISYDDETISREHEAVRGGSRNVSPTTQPVALYTIENSNYFIYSYFDQSKAIQLYDGWGNYEVFISDLNPCIAMLKQGLFNSVND